MSVLLPGLLAMAVLGAEGGPCPTAPEISYQFSVLDMDSIDWRVPIYHRLKAVDHQGGTTVWTISEETAQALRRRAAKTLTTPKVTAVPGATATVKVDDADRHYVADMERVADGPFNRASKVAFKPHVGKVAEGFHADVAGEVGDRSIRTRVSCRSTWVAAFHNIRVTEQLVDAEGVESSNRLSTMIQVPEVDGALVEGEWLVPDGEVLLVSLGARSSVDSGAFQDGAFEPETIDKALQFRERLVLVDPTVIEASAPGAELEATTETASAALRCAVPVGALLTSTSTRPIEAGPNPGPGSAPIKRMPEVPSRTLPVARTADGEEITLPPLPDDSAETVALDDESAEPRPSPQARFVPAEGRNGTIELRVKFGTSPAEPDSTLPFPVLFRNVSVGRPNGAEARDEDKAVTPASSTTTDPRGGTIRIPLGGGLAVEIKATVGPKPE